MTCPCYQAPNHCTPDHRGPTRCKACLFWMCRFNRRTRRDMSAPTKSNPVSRRIERARKIAVLEKFWKERDGN